MDASPSVSDIVATAAQLTPKELDALVGQLNKLRIRLSVPTLTKEEAELLQKINEGFPLEKWERLQKLDTQMEYAQLNEEEANESLSLAEELEAYTTLRFQYLKKLAALKTVSVEQLSHDLGISPQ